MSDAMTTSGRAAKKKQNAETYTTGEMARLSNNTLRTVRFYEEAGILEPLKRKGGGHRVFDGSQLDRLLFVSDMREAGLSLEDIRSLLTLKVDAASGGEAARAAREALTVHIAQLKTRIDVLTRLSADLTATVDSTAGCLQCDSSELFPTRCGACTTMSLASPLPRGMRVLWSVTDLRAYKRE